jgi:shikimate dehydrogenase
LIERKVKGHKIVKNYLRNISGITTVLGIIGDPLDHVPSPPMYNITFEQLGLDFVHVPLPVHSKDISEAVKGIRALNIRGVNVTMPHKRSVIPYLDEIEPLARQIGSVNAIINTGGILKGYNFDSPGFIQPLLASGFQPECKVVVVVGAGGGARAATFALADKGANLVILNRLEEFGWANDLAKDLSKYTTKSVKAIELTTANLKKYLSEAHLLVNTTCVGYGTLVKETPVPSSLLRPDLLVYDIVNNPLETRLLVESQQVGAKTIPGIEMLVGQGILFFETVTGVKAPLETMKAAVLKMITKHY